MVGDVFICVLFKWSYCDLRELTGMLILRVAAVLTESVPVANRPFRDDIGTV